MSSSSYPIKAIYDAAGTTVTGLGEFGVGDTIAMDALPTGTTSSTVALGDHHHDAIYSKKPGSQTTVERVALFADTFGNLKESTVAFAELTRCPDATAATNLAMFSNTIGDIKDSGLAIGSVVRGPDFATKQPLNTLPVFSGSGNTLVAYTAAGMVKLTAGVVSPATKGTDYVEPDTTTNFTKPQRPSFLAVSLTSTTTTHSWDLTTHQILHLTIAPGVSAELSLASSLTTALVGLSYRLIVSGAAASLTLPSLIKWVSATSPTLTNSAAKADIFTFEVMELNSSPVIVEVGRNLNVG